MKILPQTFKVLALTVLSVSSAQTFAAWELIAEMPQGAVYIDRTTIKRVGGLVSMASLTDLSFTEQQLKETPPAFRSTRQLDNFDCIKRKMRLSSYTLHTGPMGGGVTLLSSNEATAWAGIEAQGSNTLKWQAACTQR